MKPPPIELINDDCFRILPTIPDNSFDACVIDGPYGIRFMGKAWDGPDIIKEATRRDKLVVGPGRTKTGRTTSGVTAAMAAGIYNLNVNANRAFQSWTRQWAQHMFRILKPGAYIASFGSTRTYHRMASGIEDAGFEIRDQLAWIFGSGFPKSKNLDGDREGWGTALKPGWEPICLGRKPLSGTVAETVAEHGTGALNINACRIPTNEILREGTGNIPCRHNEFTPRSREGEASADRRYTENGSTNFAAKPGPRGGDAKGRWPANVCHDGSEEVLEHFPQAGGQQGALTGNEPSAAFSGEVIYGKMARTNASTPRIESDPSAARFFYCAKASRADRNAGCENMPAKQLLWSSGTQNPGSFQSENTDRNVSNFHPTVKPTALMRWLCRLITPPGGRIIDSMMGSGSTGRGAILEGFQFTGIEREGPYFAIAKARIAEAQGELFTP
jgi:site-specific DNA-methyltransferase (adenine-specific)